MKQALPALARGAERAGRPTPPLVAHVPVAVTADRETARALARTQLGNYGRTPFYQLMFEEAGFPGMAEGYSDALLDNLVISGSEQAVAEQLRGLSALGFGEVLAAPIIDPDDREGSISRAFAAVGRAATTT